MSNTNVRAPELKLEVVTIPVSDIDRAKSFYTGLGWRLDADISGDNFRVIQVTRRARRPR
jgi:catechol 2,3-dioxygenase-like lactoylglutathione lyase family enzyme